MDENIFTTAVLSIIIQRPVVYLSRNEINIKNGIQLVSYILFIRITSNRDIRRFSCPTISISVHSKMLVSGVGN